jgi:heme exporter protein A
MMRRRHDAAVESTNEQKDQTLSTQREAPLAVSISSVTKAFGRTTALRSVDLELSWGQCLVVFGHNGAGKSTLMRVLATLVQPDSGTVRVAGYDSRRQATQARASVGYLGHRTLLYNELTPRENLRFYARLYSLPDAERRITQLLEELGVANSAGRRVGTLSNGMQKRVALARALLHQPPLLLLDEPETGLDKQAQELLYSLMRTAAEGGASVIMTTHGIDRGLEVADHVAVLVRGSIALQSPIGDIVATTLERLLDQDGGSTP